MKKNVTNRCLGGAALALLVALGVGGAALADQPSQPAFPGNPSPEMLELLMMSDEEINARMAAQVEAYEAELAPYLQFVPQGQTCAIDSQIDLPLFPYNADFGVGHHRAAPWDGTLEVTVNGAWMYPSVEEAATEHDLGLILRENPPERFYSPTDEPVQLLVMELTIHNVDADPSLGAGKTTFETQAFVPCLRESVLESKNPTFPDLATNSGTPFDLGHPDANNFACEAGQTVILTLGYWVWGGLEPSDFALRPNPGSMTHRGPWILYLAPQDDDTDAQQTTL